MPHLIIYLIIILISTSCSPREKDLTYTIREGKFDASIFESGELQAVHSNSVNVPNINWRYGNQFKLVALAEHGIKVKTDDVVAEIDKSVFMKTLLDMQNRLETEQNNLDKMIIQQNTREQELKTGLLTQEASFEMAKLQLEKFKFESEKRLKIKQLEFDRTSITRQKVKDQYNASLITNKKSLFVQRIKIRQIQNTINDINRNLSMLVIKSPCSGILQLRTNQEKGQMIKIGDNVWPGVMIASVPDLSEMKVIANINETDIGKLRLNQKVIVRLQAFIEVPFEGTITKIWPICYSKDPKNQPDIKVFDFEIMLKKSDPLLKPGMSVSCEVFYAQLDDVFFVENDCIVRTDSLDYVITKSGNKKIPVTLGPGNNKFTVIYGDLESGEMLIPRKNIQTIQKN